jgi:hypothetical protein
MRYPTQRNFVDDSRVHLAGPDHQRGGLMASKIPPELGRAARLTERERSGRPVEVFEDPLTAPAFSMDATIWR